MQEFVAKLGVVRGEADEVVFWLEFGQQSGLVDRSVTAALLSESRELAAIVAAAYRTSKTEARRQEGFK